MFGKPKVAVRAIAAVIRDVYGIVPAAIDLLPLGRDSNAWVYRVSSETGARYLLKLRRGHVEQAGIAVPRYLYDHGIHQAVPPLATMTGALSAAIRDFVLVLYPFVAGVSGTERPLTDRQWVDYGAFLRTLHDIRLPPELEAMVPRETYRPYNIEFVRGLLARPPAARQPLQERAELAASWRVHAIAIDRLVHRADELGRRVAARSLGAVVCHADIHLANLLLEEKGDVRVVDWDGVVLAPRERDLMFIIRGVVAVPRVEPWQEDLFFQGYASRGVDEVALAYFRHAWAVQDIGEYAEEVLLRKDGDQASRRLALKTFAGLFGPGDEVASANESWERVGGDTGEESASATRLQATRYAASDDDRTPFNTRGG
jgi:spectinomycin phosphotransferase